MMTDYRQQIAAAVAATEIQGRLRYAWFGKPSRPPARDVRRALNGEAERGCLRAKRSIRAIRPSSPTSRSRMRAR